MRFTPAILTAVLSLAFSAHAAIAASPQAGEDAPGSLGTVAWVNNAPAIDNIDDLTGDVTIVLVYRSDSHTNTSFLDEIDQWYVDRHAAGLNVLAVDCSQLAAPAIRMSAMRLGLSMPVAAGNASSYTCENVPHAWVIGVDGNVAFETVGRIPQTGRSYNPAIAFDGLKNAVDDAMKLVAYPGLGMLAVEKDASKVAKYFVKGDYGKARKEATKVLEDEDTDAATREDVDFIVARMLQIADAMLARATAFEEARYFLDAFTTYEAIAELFKKEAEAERAEARIGELKKDDAARREMEAESALRNMMASSNNAADLGTFVSQYAGTRAAEDVEALLGAMGSGGR